MGQPYNPPGENAIITAPDPAILADVVEGDQLTMYVEVAGTTTYESQIGGNVTVPTFTAYIVERLRKAREKNMKRQRPRMDPRAKAG